MLPISRSASSDFSSGRPWSGQGLHQLRYYPLHEWKKGAPSGLTNENKDEDHTTAHSLLAELGQKSGPTPTTACLYGEPCVGFLWHDVSACQGPASLMSIHRALCHATCPPPVLGDQPLSAWTLGMSAPTVMSSQWFSRLYSQPNPDTSLFKRTRDSLSHATVFSLHLSEISFTRN